MSKKLVTTEEGVAYEDPDDGRTERYIQWLKNQAEFSIRRAGAIPENYQVDVRVRIIVTMKEIEDLD